MTVVRGAAPRSHKRACRKNECRTNVLVVKMCCQKNECRRKNFAILVSHKQLSQFVSCIDYRPTTTKMTPR